MIPVEMSVLGCSIARCCWTADGQNSVEADKLQYS